MKGLTENYSFYGFLKLKDYHEFLFKDTYGAHGDYAEQNQ